jgi:uncharacterized protein YbjT (DUF2867 family)
VSARVAVVGASGKTGRAVAAALARRGAEPVPIGRAQWGDLAGAMRGCDAVHVIAPNMHEDEPAFAAEVLAAARGAGVTRVSHHSVAAPYAPSMPHHLGKARTEDLVRRTTERWTILQPCAYVQNFVPALRSGSGTLEVAYRVDRPFGLVDLDDVAEATATVLLEPGHEGATYELGGPAPVTVEDVAATAGEVLGRRIEAVRVDPVSWAEGPGAGLDPRVREWLLAMFAYYDGCGLPTGPVPLGALLGRPPTALADTLRAALSVSATPA